MPGQVLTFLDVETTGLIDIFPTAEITEIAIVSWQDGATEVVLHERVKPKHGMPAEPRPFNKSYDEELWKTAEVWDADVSEIVSGLVNGQYLCGSNPEFDKRMITAECFRAGAKQPRWHHRGINTSTLGFPLYLLGEVEQTGLEHLAKYFGIKHEAHTALGDCMAAIGVWEAFFDMYVYRPREMKKALESIMHETEGNRDLATTATIYNAARSGLLLIGNE
jgi:DNA polymerase III epsilon subunit-like protein